MTIVAENSLLVIGAGVSAPFGIPLGGELIEKLGSAIGSELRLEGLEKQICDAQTDVSAWLRAPILSAMYATHDDYIASIPGSGKFEHIRAQGTQLAKLLNGQTAETIDAFIAENPNLAKPAKIAIAASILRSCYDYVEAENKLSVKPFADRRLSPPRIDRDGNTTPGERNWIHLLINIVRHGVRNGEILPPRRVPIVTFNYDTILEYVLESQFGNVEGGTRHWSEYFEILHVHGQFGRLESECQLPATTAVKWANGICVVHESRVPGDLAGVRVRAQSLVRTAKKIYICGFSFAKANCELIHLNQMPTEMRHVAYCNYDGDIGVKEAATQYVSSGRSSNPMSFREGSRERAISVSAWIKGGHIGPLPG